MKLQVSIKNPATGKLCKVATATPTGIKLGGKVQPAGVVFGLMPKGEARKMRKQLRAGGFARHAGEAVAVS